MYFFPVISSILFFSPFAQRTTRREGKNPSIILHCVRCLPRLFSLNSEERALDTSVSWSFAFNWGWTPSYWYDDDAAKGSSRKPNIGLVVIAQVQVNLAVPAHLISSLALGTQDHQTMCTLVRRSAACRSHGSALSNTQQTLLHGQTTPSVAVICHAMLSLSSSTDWSSSITVIAAVPGPQSCIRPG